MKEFDKKLKEIGPQYESPNWFGGYRAGWKEALNWVVKRGMHQYDNDFLCMDVCKDIQEELEEE